MKQIYTIFSTCLIWVAIVLNQQAWAQNISNNNAGHCGSDFLLKSIDPARIQHFEQGLYDRTLLRGGSPASDTDQFVIPVAFHIIHQNGVENISDQQVWDALHLLNNSFANEAPFDPAAGINADISFCLAPDMISRHVSGLTDMTMETDDPALKQIGVVDPEIYINIWVVNSIGSFTMGPGVAGYAMMPASHGGPVDGIVIEAAFINNNPDDVKVLVHEVGHYLGLYHTFEGGCTNNNCMTDGDRVCDTPPDNSIAPVQCTGSANTCHSDPDDPSTNNPFRDIALGGMGDQPDMFQNYMDYGFQSCQTKFTDGQRTRMRDVLRTTRHSLLEHPNYCLPCTSPVTGTLNIPPILPAGVPATFSVTGSDPSLLHIWVMNGQNSIGQTITQTYPEEVTVYITVYVIDPAAPGCSLTLRDTVDFICGIAQPTFSVTPYGLTSTGQSITFTTPDNGYNYTWNIDGVATGTGTTFNYTVTGNYGRLVTLVADNGTCRSVSEPYYIDPNNCSGSKENNTWYFGTGGGIDFNSNPPEAIQGKIYTEEGCAVLSDANTGAPVFHSDGVTVANSQTGLVLLNGFGLTGHPSTTQSALFVPMPGSSRYVYLFTVDCQAGDFTNVGGGIFYSIIDRQGDGGHGAVTLKNQLLVQPVPEKVTAVKNMAGDGIWVIAHLWNSDAFYAWEITSTGIGTPVISHVGSIHTSAPVPYSGAYALGELKASPSGKKLALADQGHSFFELFDFNNNTGVISNAVHIQNDEIHNNYGVAFSPDEHFLYGSAIGPADICRFDITAGNAATINASFTPVGSLAERSGGSIQLAPDGKIYGACRGSHYLSVISNPNALNVADCGFNINGFRLKDYTLSYYGLPNPVQSVLLSINPAIIGPDKICLNTPSQSHTYSFDPAGNAAYTWSHHGPNSLSVINDSTATINYSMPGADTLIVTRVAPCGNSYDTLFITTGTAPAFDIGADRLVCPGTSVTITALPGMFDYSWNNGTNMQSNTVNTPGKIKVEVITPAGCVLTDSLMVNNYSIPDLDPGRDTSICTTETLTINAPLGMTSYLWSTGANTNSITVSDSGTYAVTIQNDGCTFKDSILVRKDIVSDVISTDTVVRCINGQGFFSAPAGFDTYSWQLPSGAIMNTDTVSINDPGYYVLTYSNRCGSATDSVLHFIPRIWPQDTLVSCADTIRVVANLSLMGVASANPDYNSYVLDTDTIDIYRSGEYLGLTLYPGTSTCLLAQPMIVLVDTALTKPPKSIDLGPDAAFCEGYVLPLNAGSGFESYHWNTGSVDSATTVYGFGAYTVTAHYCGFDYTDTIIISRINSFTVDLGPDQDVCPPLSLTLDAGPGYDWYLWDNGEQTQQIMINSTGHYHVQVGLNGCVGRDTVTIACTIGIEKPVDCGEPFYLTPNPGNDIVVLGQKCERYKNITVSISGSDGKQVANTKGSLSDVNTYMNQLMRSLSPAVYIIRIDAENERYYFKWMIVK